MSNLPYSSNQNSSSKLSKFDWPFLVKFYTFMFVSLIDVCEIYRTLFEPIGKRWVKRVTEFHRLFLVMSWMKSHKSNAYVSMCVTMCFTIVFWHNNRVDAGPPAAVVSRVTRGQHHPLQPGILTTAWSWVRETVARKALATHFLSSVYSALLSFCWS